MRQSNTLARSFKLQIDVIWALIIREMHTRFGRENIGFLWFIGEPILFCGGVTIVWSAIRPAHEHGIPVSAFVISGYVPLTIWRHCVGRSVRAYESNGALMFHRQITPLDIITARVILEIIGTLAAGLLISTITILAGFMSAPLDYGLLYLGLVYHVFFCYACSLLIASLSERSDLVEKTIQVFMYLSIPMSGAFAMTDWLPPGAQAVVLWSPSVQDLEMIRGGLFGPGVHPMFNLVYNTQCIMIMLFIGISLTLRVRKHIVIQ